MRVGGVPRTFVLPLLLLPGCLYVGAGGGFDPADARTEPGWVLIDVPVIRQGGADGCGAACAQMVARHWLGEEAGHRVRAGVPVHPGRGSRADDLLAGLRSVGLEAFLQAGTMEQIGTHLAKGRPMIAGLIQAYRGGVRRTHYVVVAGADPARGILAVVDPARGWRCYPYAGFRAEWEPSGGVLVVAAPVPAAPAPDGTEGGG
ncbi:MAG: hypothetical protein HY608_04845 [Planctomycetes bacterium]|nr:hypothetical protein [Planctomycetota bacterium]